MEPGPVLITQEQHPRREDVEVLLIRHRPSSVHYHGSDTFCQDEEENQALNQQPPASSSLSGSCHEVIEIESNSESESECSERNSLMASGKTRSYDKLGHSSSRPDNSEAWKSSAWQKNLCHNTKEQWLIFKDLKRPKDITEFGELQIWCVYLEISSILQCIFISMYIIIHLICHSKISYRYR